MNNIDPRRNPPLDYGARRVPLRAMAVVSAILGLVPYPFLVIMLVPDRVYFAIDVEHRLWVLTAMASVPALSPIVVGGIAVMKMNAGEGQHWAKHLAMFGILMGTVWLVAGVVRIWSPLLGY